MNTPRFSVIIPLYNKASHIAETIGSVLAQTERDFEIVVVDDGSGDGGGDVVAAFNEPRVRLIRQENAGVAAARNRGAEVARGEYLAFLDADDSWLPWHLVELNKLIRAFPEAGLYSVAYEILQEGCFYRPSSGTGKDFFGVVEDFFGAFSSGMALVHSSTACVRKDVFSDSGGFPVGVTRGEDVYLWMVVAVDRGLAHSAKVCARMNRDAENRSNNSTNPEVQYYLPYLDELLRHNRLALSQVPSARKMLRRGLVLAAAGFALDGNCGALRALHEIPSARTDWRVRTALGLLKIVPVAVLRTLRRYRHRRSLETSAIAGPK